MIDGSNRAIYIQNSATGNIIGNNTIDGATTGIQVDTNTGGVNIFYNNIFSVITWVRIGALLPA